jgi:hypothetical protein
VRIFLQKKQIMKLKHLLILLITLLAASCKKDNETAVDPNTLIINDGGTINGTYTTGQKVVVKKGTVTLKGYTYFESGSQITIEPGTIIKSDIASKGALIIERGAKIFAEGTASLPIVFTSGKAVGERNPGDWGGIIVLGNAPTNRATEPTIEGGVGKKYGGTDPNDNSGVIKYVRIEFAGIADAPGSEINGLTLGGVGAGTTIDYVQVTYGNDDAYEFFGGTVNAKHLVAYGTADDDFDFDFGYVGKIQHAFSLRNPEFVDGGDAGNGIECDNDATGTLATPITRPNLSNFTILGPNDAANTAANHNYSLRFRRATQFVLNNSILLGHPDAGLSLESDATYNAFIDGTSQFKNNLIFASSNIFRIGSVSVAGASAANVQTKATNDGTTVLANVAAASLTNPFNLTAPNALPTSGAAALSGATFTGVQADAFFDKVAYKGAFGATNWTSGWANFNFTKGANGY